MNKTPMSSHSGGLVGTGTLANAGDVGLSFHAFFFQDGGGRTFADAVSPPLPAVSVWVRDSLQAPPLLDGHARSAPTIIFHSDSFQPIAVNRGSVEKSSDYATFFMNGDVFAPVFLKIDIETMKPITESIKSIRRP
jgi:hypothetical protein